MFSSQGSSREISSTNIPDTDQIVVVLQWNERFPLILENNSS